jgi:hypothetical protein
LLLYPGQLGQALEDMKTAGVPDEELRAIAAAYEAYVDRNEKPRVALRPSATNPDSYDVIGVSIKDQNWADRSYGRYEQVNVVTAEGAYTGRVQSDRWENVVEAIDPRQTAELIEQAKRHYPHLAGQIDALYHQVRATNAEQWAHEQRIGGQIPAGVIQIADQWAGRPIDWHAAQARAARATAEGWARAFAPLVNGMAAQEPDAAKKPNAAPALAAAEEPDPAGAQADSGGSGSGAPPDAGPSMFDEP